MRSKPTPTDFSVDELITRRWSPRAFTDEPVEVPGVSGRWVGGTARPGETPAPGQGLGPDEARVVDPRG